MRHALRSVRLLVGGSALVAAAAAALPAAAAEGHNVTIVLPEALDIVEPCHSSRSNIGRVIKQNVVETFTEINPEDGSVTPRLATEWEQVDGDTWRFKLREGVKFQDGADFNAESAIYAINRTLDPSLDCENRTKFFGGIKVTVEAVDDHTVDITTDPAQPILPTLMGTMPVVSPNMPMGEFTRKPVGTGPYVFAEWDPTRHVILERFDGYWGEQPQVEKATYVWRDESAVRAAMVAAGEADIAPVIAQQDATNPETDFSYLNSETTRLRISVDVPPLDDVRVRKAMNLAVDREALVGSILSQDVIPATQLVVPSINGHNPNLEPWPYDPEQAKKLLAEAKADGVAVDTQISMIYRSGVHPNAAELAEALRAMLSDVGLNVSLQMVEVAQWVDLATKPYAEDRPPTLLSDMHDNNNGDAIFTVYYKYHSQGAQADLADPKVDKLIEQANAATNPERRELYQEVFRQLREEIVPDIMLFHMVGYTRVSPRLNFTPSLSTNSELQLSQISFKD